MQAYHNRDPAQGAGRGGRGGRGRRAFPTPRPVRQPVIHRLQPTPVLDLLHPDVGQIGTEQPEATINTIRQSILGRLNQYSPAAKRDQGTVEQRWPCAVFFGRDGNDHRVNLSLIVPEGMTRALRSIPEPRPSTAQVCVSMDRVLALFARWNDHLFPELADNASFTRIWCGSYESMLDVLEIEDGLVLPREINEGNFEDVVETVFQAVKTRVEVKVCINVYLLLVSKQWTNPH